VLPGTCSADGMWTAVGVPPACEYIRRFVASSMDGN